MTGNSIQIVNPLLTISVLPQYRTDFVHTILCWRLFVRQKESAEEHTMLKSESALPIHHQSLSTSAISNGTKGWKKRHPHLSPPHLLNHNRRQSNGGSAAAKAARRRSQPTTHPTSTNDFSLGQLKEELEETRLMQGMNVSGVAIFECADEHTGDATALHRATVLLEGDWGW